jgi:hypothetical protein
MLDVGYTPVRLPICTFFLASVIILGRAEFALTETVPVEQNAIGLTIVEQNAVAIAICAEMCKFDL